MRWYDGRALHWVDRPLPSTLWLCVVRRCLCVVCVAGRCFPEWPTFRCYCSLVSHFISKTLLCTPSGFAAKTAGRVRDLEEWFLMKTRPEFLQPGQQWYWHWPSPCVRGMSLCLRHWEWRELCVLCHPIISLMSRPQEGGRGEAAGRTEKDVQKKTNGGLGEREQLEDFFPLLSHPYPFPQHRPV